MATDSFTSFANAVTSDVATLMAIESFTSSAAAVALGVGVLSDPAQGSKVFTPEGWAIRVTAAGVTISKAPTFGGVQVSPPWPVSLDAARDLAQALILAAN